MADVTPWWETLDLRDEIKEAGGNINDVQTSLYHAVHEPEKVPYSDIGYYSDITHPTSGLVELGGRIAARLASDNPAAVKPIWRGDQGMGGGKSHAEVGLFHMANDPAAFFASSLGELVRERAEQIAGGPILDDLGDPVVVVLPCDKMDPFHPDKNLDNIADTLGERWLWRAVEGDLSRFHDLKGDLGTPPGIGRIIDAVGGRVLTLVDEVLNYIRKATADAGNTDRAQQDVAFLRDLMDATNTSDHAAMVVVMIASDDDTVSMGDFGETIRDEMEDLLYRYARSIATTSGGDFAEIIRRRLFTDAPSNGAVDALIDAYKDTASTGGWQTHFKKFDWWAHEFDEKVIRAYPFHPALIDLVETEWANRAGFQKVRSTIQIFAATVHAWITRAEAEEWAPPLIGLGDLVLSDNLVRDAILDSGVVVDSKLVTNYREIAGNDIVASDDTRGTARQLDVNREDGLFTGVNPRVAERIATALFITSLAPRPQGDTGATDSELRVAAFVPNPGCQLGDVDAAAQQLEDTQTGIATLEVKPGSGGQPRRLLIQTQQTLPMFYRSQRNAVTDEQTDEALRDAARRLVKKGPFDDVTFVDASDVSADAASDELAAGLLGAIRDAQLDDDTTRMAVLDPSRFTLLNGVDSECRAAIAASFGLPQPDDWGNGPWPEQLSCVYPSSLVYVVVNTYRRRHVKQAATDMLAWERVANIPAVAAEDPLREQAEAKARDFRDQLETSLRKAFQHIVYYGTGPEAKTIRVESDHMTALDGTVTWKLLVEHQRALDAGGFDAVALLHHLRDEDYNSSLSTIRNAYYKTPRLPMLHGGDTDLQHALFEAITRGDIELRVSGEVVTPPEPSHIGLNTSNVLARPSSPDEKTADGTEKRESSDGELSGTSHGAPIAADGGEGGYTSDGGPGIGAAPRTDGTTPAAEIRLTLGMPGTDFSNPAEAASIRQMLMRIGDAIDEGDATFGQINLSVVVPAKVAEEVRNLSGDFTGQINEQQV